MRATVAASSCLPTSFASARSRLSFATSSRSEVASWLGKPPSSAAFATASAADVASVGGALLSGACRTPADVSEKLSISRSQTLTRARQHPSWRKLLVEAAFSAFQMHACRACRCLPIGVVYCVASAAAATCRFKRRAMTTTHEQHQVHAFQHSTTQPTSWARNVGTSHATKSANCGCCWLFVCCGCFGHTWNGCQARV